jgi:hypothetical protein
LFLLIKGKELWILAAKGMMSNKAEELAMRISTFKDMTSTCEIGKKTSI